MISLRFSAVGIYCFLEKEVDVTPSDKIDVVMGRLNDTLPVKNQVHFVGTPFLDSLTYIYNDGSIKPPQAQDKPNLGPRSLANVIDTSPGALSRVWQYYRSVIAKPIGNTSMKLYEIRLPTTGQPPYTTQELVTPEELLYLDGFTIMQYSITWRQISIRLTAKNAGSFLQSKLDSLETYQQVLEKSSLL